MRSSLGRIRPQACFKLISQLSAECNTTVAIPDSTELFVPKAIPTLQRRTPTLNLYSIIKFRV
ncbi:MAG: hypothetical protein ACTSVT_12045 [Candidatus Thorarchaeota archaeon]